MADKLEPTPNIPWGWEQDEAGNTLLYIRGADGARCSVVLDPMEVHRLRNQLSVNQWDRDEKERQKRIAAGIKAPD